MDRVLKGNFQKVAIGKLAIFGNGTKPVQHFIKTTTASTNPTHSI